jgi:hypothetical protein
MRNKRKRIEVFIDCLTQGRAGGKHRQGLVEGLKDCEGIERVDGVPTAEPAVTTLVVSGVAALPIFRRRARLHESARRTASQYVATLRSFLAVGRICRLAEHLPKANDPATMGVRK